MVWRGSSAVGGAARVQFPRATVAALLVGLVLACGSALASRSGRSAATAEAAQRELADGALDGAARRAALQQVLAAAEAPGVGDAVLGPALLAALALEARPDWARLSAAVGLGTGSLRWPSGGLPTSWAMGDPLLANTGAALAAEARGDRPEAVSCWRRVAAQANLTGAGFAAELAAAALQRLS
jgi:hypothetical protein